MVIGFNFVNERIFQRPRQILAIVSRKRRRRYETFDSLIRWFFSFARRSVQFSRKIVAAFAARIDPRIATKRPFFFRFLRDQRDDRSFPLGSLLGFLYLDTLFPSTSRRLPPEHLFASISVVLRLSSVSVREVKLKRTKEVVRWDSLVFFVPRKRPISEKIIRKEESRLLLRSCRPLPPPIPPKRIL